MRIATPRPGKKQTAIKNTSHFFGLATIIKKKLKSKRDVLLLLFKSFFLPSAKALVINLALSFVLSLVIISNALLPILIKTARLRPREPHRDRGGSHCRDNAAAETVINPDHIL